ncbi:MAG: glycogen/starch/alpha-glucan phosphorylase [Acetobacteraceae bacterium]
MDAPTDLAPANPTPAHLDVDALHEAIRAKLLYAIGKTPERASARDWFVATALVVRDNVVDTWTVSARDARATKAKRVHYFSLEFLIGRLLFDAAGNLGMIEVLRAALAREGVDLETVRALEPDAALGNGGLGRLAACFMESGEHGHAGDPRLRLRHPLRLWAVPPIHP